MGQERGGIYSFVWQEPLHHYPLQRASCMCHYVAFLAKDNLKHQTIKTYLSAVRHINIVAGEGDPFKEDMPLLEYTVRGIKGDQARNSESVPCTRLPITPDILLQLRKVWERDASNPTHIMLWAAVCTCFFGFLRSGEICVTSANDYDPGAHLSFGDVLLDSTVDPQVAQVNIKASKTELPSPWKQRPPLSTDCPQWA